jgi:hypothetical protein
MALANTGTPNKYQVCLTAIEKNCYCFLLATRAIFFFNGALEKLSQRTSFISAGGTG